MSKNLLVIDDDIGLARVVSYIVTSLGYNVRTVTEPTLASEVFLEFKPDVVLLDLVMPEKDGIDVLHEILATGVQSRVILMSEYSDQYIRLAEDVAKFHGTDPLSVMRKPFRRDDLVSLLERVPSYA